MENLALAQELSRTIEHDQAVRTRIGNIEQLVSADHDVLGTLIPRIGREDWHIGGIDQHHRFLRQRGEVQRLCTARSEQESRKQWQDEAEFHRVLKR